MGPVVNKNWRTGELCITVELLMLSSAAAIVAACSSAHNPRKPALIRLADRHVEWITSHRVARSGAFPVCGARGYSMNWRTVRCCTAGDSAQSMSHWALRSFCRR